jgi:hypothetical protein
MQLCRLPVTYLRLFQQTCAQSQALLMLHESMYGRRYICHTYTKSKCRQKKLLAQHARTHRHTTHTHTHIHTHIHTHTHSTIMTHTMSHDTHKRSAHSKHKHTQQLYTHEHEHLYECTHCIPQQDKDYRRFRPTCSSASLDHHKLQSVYLVHVSQQDLHTVFGSSACKMDSHKGLTALHCVCCFR